jgi:hypothetical protein
MNLLNCNHRVRREIMESTALIRRAAGLISQQGCYGALAFMAEYVSPVTRHASLHVRHAPLLEPGYPAVAVRAPT